MHRRNRLNAHVINRYIFITCLWHIMVLLLFMYIQQSTKYQYIRRIQSTLPYVSRKCTVDEWRMLCNCRIHSSIIRTHQFTFLYFYVSTTTHCHVNGLSRSRSRSHSHFWHLLYVRLRSLTQYLLVMDTMFRIQIMCTFNVTHCEMYRMYEQDTLSWVVSWVSEISLKEDKWRDKQNLNVFARFIFFLIIIFHGLGRASCAPKCHLNIHNTYYKIEFEKSSSIVHNSFQRKTIFLSIYPYDRRMTYEQKY